MSMFFYQSVLLEYSWVHLHNKKMLRPTVLDEMHLQENISYDLIVGIKVTLDITQHPLQHVTYAPAKFEVATSNGLGADKFERGYEKRVLKASQQ